VGSDARLIAAVSATDGAMLSNAMTVDVEDYFHVQAFAAHIDRSSWDGRESRVVANTWRLLEMFDEFGVRATFFVLGWVAEREPALVKEIHARGHEVACHGYSHRLVYTQTPAEFAEEARRAKDILEDITGDPVLGYRAASYSIVRESLWALDILIELGFHYDSSIFPVHHDNYGIPDARREPHRLAAPGGGTIVEWPLSTVNILGFRLPVAGGGYFRLVPYWLTRTALRSINQEGGTPFIFYLHPWEIDPAQPRIQANWLSRFRHYNNLHRCEVRLRGLLADFRFEPIRAVLERLHLLGATCGATA
jgi:polysaccharide deacetylase family protein (PEP-CTERM system associated)